MLRSGTWKQLCVAGPGLALKRTSVTIILKTDRIKATFRNDEIKTQRKFTGYCLEFENKHLY